MCLIHSSTISYRTGLKAIVKLIYILELENFADVQKLFPDTLISIRNVVFFVLKFYHR